MLHVEEVPESLSLLSESSEPPVRKKKDHRLSPFIFLPKSQYESDS